MNAGNGSLEATLRRTDRWLANSCREHYRRGPALVAAEGL